MLIECRIRRLTGSTVDFRGDTEITRYRFWPRDDKGKLLDIKDKEIIKDAPHICEVNEIAHQRRLIMECAPSFVPYGDAAINEATDRFGWTKNQGRPTAPVARVASGQPPVSLEIVDDDETPPEGDGDEESTEENGVDSNAPPPPPPPEGVVKSKEDWEQWAAGLGIADPTDKKALETYARNNYGIDLDCRRGHIVLIREIYQAAQRAVDA